MLRTLKERWSGEEEDKTEEFSHGLGKKNMHWFILPKKHIKRDGLVFSKKCQKSNIDFLIYNLF